MQFDRAGRPTVAVVDYGLGNLYSVGSACAWAGMVVEVTSSARVISKADGVILPGVGAFGDAVSSLDKLDLAAVLQDVARAGKPLIGICLGMQLLFSESEEFGTHPGLDLISGRVVRFPESTEKPAGHKVPQVGWNQVNPRRDPDVRGASPSNLGDALLDGTRDGEYMYFVHAYYALPAEASVVFSSTRFAGVTFASAVGRRNVFGCQFHPERSGPAGLRIYSNLAKTLWRSNG